MDEDDFTELRSAAYQLISELDHLVGATLGGRFVIDEHLQNIEGRVVYSGRQPALDRPVAIKLVHDASNQELCRRFLREGRLLAKLDHPGIVSVIDVGEHEGRPYVITEAPRGDSLETILEVRGRIDWRAALDLLIALADAVGAAHAAGLVHRDLHPRNILVGADGQPHITDFVFAYEAASYTDQESAQLRTSRGAMVGAVEWVAPEQLMGFPVDMRADLYSLGVLAYRMIAGQLPYRSSRAAEILSQQVNGTIPLMKAGELLDEARPFAELIDRLMHHDPNGRGFANASELAKALRTLRSSPPAEPNPAPREQKPTPSGEAISTQQDSGSSSTTLHAMRERTVGLAQAIAAGAQPFVANALAKAKALPPKTRLAVASGALVLSLLIAIAWGDDEPEVEVESVGKQELAQPTTPEIDPAMIAIRSDAREAAEANDVPRALHGYRTLSREAFEEQDFQNVVQYLARPNTNTGVAEKILVGTAPASVPALRSAFESEQSARYLKRRAGEVLEKLGEPVDLVPLWIGTLQSDECNARRLAVKKLVDSGDERAIAPLNALAHSRSCGAPEARSGLKSMN